MSKVLNLKVILIVLAGLILTEAIWAVSSFSKNKAVSPAAIRQAQPSISLSSLKQQYSLGETFQVDISVDTGSFATDGVDVILLFDPKTVEVMLDSSKKPVRTGQIYKDYPSNSVDPTGRIALSGVVAQSGNFNASFSGQGSLGSVTFKTVGKGRTTIKVDFIPSQTIDSNITESVTAKDILAKVKNLNIEVK